MGSIGALVGGAYLAADISMLKLGLDVGGRGRGGRSF